MICSLFAVFFDAGLGSNFSGLLSKLGSYFARHANDGCFHKHGHCLIHYLYIKVSEILKSMRVDMLQNSRACRM